MTKQSLAAALYLAYAVAAQDGFQEEESWVLGNELNSFKLSDEDNAQVTELFKRMDVDTAVDIIRDSDQATKDEAQAVIFLTLLNDRVIDPAETSAYQAICERCGLIRSLSINDAHAIIGF